MLKTSPIMVGLAGFCLLIMSFEVSADPIELFIEIISESYEELNASLENLTTELKISNNLTEPLTKAIDNTLHKVINEADFFIGDIRLRYILYGNHIYAYNYPSKLVGPMLDWLTGLMSSTLKLVSPKLNNTKQMENVFRALDEFVLNIDKCRYLTDNSLRKQIKKGTAEDNSFALALIEVLNKLVQSLDGIRKQIGSLLDSSTNDTTTSLNFINQYVTNTLSNLLISVNNLPKSSNEAVQDALSSLTAAIEKIQ